MTTSQTNAAEPARRGRPSPRKDRAIQALLQHPTLEKAAQAVGVHTATLRRWRKQPEFQARYREALNELAAQVQGHLQQIAPTAFWVAARILRDPKVPPATQLRAALYFLKEAGVGGKGATPPPAEELRVVFVKGDQQRPAGAESEKP